MLISGLGQSPRFQPLGPPGLSTFSKLNVPGLCQDSRLQLISPPGLRIYSLRHIFFIDAFSVSFPLLFHNRIPYIYNLLVNLKLKLSVIKQIKIYILSIQITPIASVDTSIIQMFICFTFKWLVHKCLASVKKIYERRSAE